MSAPDVDVVGGLVAYLGDPSNAEPADLSPPVPSRANHPGLYAWWADADGLALLSMPFHQPLSRLIYAGQTGATSTKAGQQSSATLRSRISSNHLNGNIAASTFRATLTAVLLEPLSLCLAVPRRLDKTSNQALSKWMRQHLRVAIIPFDDRDGLVAVEHSVLARLDPPLNLMGMPATPVRGKLGELRHALQTPTLVKSVP
jgi:hypothetical protein